MSSPQSSSVPSIPAQLALHAASVILAAGISWGAMRADAASTAAQGKAALELATTIAAKQQVQEVRTAGLEQSRAETASYAQRITQLEAAAASQKEAFADLKRDMGRVLDEMTGLREDLVGRRRAAR